MPWSAANIETRHSRRRSPRRAASLLYGKGTGPSRVSSSVRERWAGNVAVSAQAKRVPPQFNLSCSETTSGSAAIWLVHLLPHQHLAADTLVVVGLGRGWRIQREQP
jgi:hypothetical protein